MFLEIFPVSKTFEISCLVTKVCCNIYIACPNVQHLQVKVTCYLSRVQYPWCHCVLCPSATVEKITV